MFPVHRCAHGLCTAYTGSQTLRTVLDTQEARQLLAVSKPSSAWGTEPRTVKVSLGSRWTCHLMLKSQRLEFRVDKEKGNLKRSSRALSKLGSTGHWQPQSLSQDPREEIRGTVLGTNAGDPYRHPSRLCPGFLPHS